MEIFLGTAQLGMDYGIQGARKPTKDKAFALLDYACKNGINTLDTACGYGDAHRLIGDYFAASSNNMNIISKLPYELEADNLNYYDRIREQMETSLKELRVPKIRGLLLHNPKQLYEGKSLEALRNLKELGYCDLIGVSVYEPEDADYAVKEGMDIIQLPMNIFDQRFDSFVEQNNSRIKIMVRSIFLQGLLLMEMEQVKEKLPIAVAPMQQFNNLCAEHSYSRREVALAYLKEKQGVTSLVVGVDNTEQLEENLKAYEQKVPVELVEEIAGYFKNLSEDIISPLKWKRR
ncbi:MAG: aldo/keto reductase [Mobilitalea sp.]